eukprot:351062_1
MFRMYDPIYDVEWIQSRTGTEFVSISTDGVICWWDSRKLSTGPMDQMILCNDFFVNGGTSLEYRTDAGATKYLVGTDQVGDWMARIWTEDIKTPIMSTRYESHYLTSGIWSPTRPGVFYITKQNGELDIWDYYYKGQFKPAYSVKISEKYSLSDCKISLKSQGKLVGVGCADGSVTILELSNSLYQSNNLNMEKQAITQLFERETNREKCLQAAKLAQQRAKKLQMKKDKVKPSKKQEEKETEKETQFELTDFGAVEADFLNFIEKNKPKQPLNQNEKENIDVSNQ